MESNPFILLEYLKKNIKSSAKIVIDTRKLLPGDIFFSYSVGYENNNRDNYNYINLAIENKAGIIVFDSTGIDDEKITEFKHLNCIEYINLANDAGLICSEWYSNSKYDCKIIGVTGTNGKTSITQWLTQILDKKYKTASIGTLGVCFNNQFKNTGYTTPDAAVIQYEIKQLFEKKINYLVLEVTSHALDQGRVNGIHFKTAIFTNLTHDHLDYHKTIENYGKAKEKLFNYDSLENVIINIDDDFGKKITQNLLQKQKKVNIWIYSINNKNYKTFMNDNINHIYLLDYKIIENGYVCSLIINNSIIDNVFLPVFFKYNISNCLSIICVLLTENIEIQEILLLISKICSVPGRMERIRLDNFPDIIIDYAHTPDSFEKNLINLKYLKKNDEKIWCIFGCGGNRDITKRPIMGKIAQANSDYIIITNDNPRFEDPYEIISMILSGIDDKLTNTKIYTIIDRKIAIEYAINHAKQNDIILITGKGHETTQEIKGIKYIFSDKECVNNIIKFKNKE